MEAHSDQAPLIEALDAWFAILRTRTGALIPLKPARPSDLGVLRSRLGIDLPPDVVALYEYTNGAWLDRKTPLNVFVPNWGRFPVISRYMFSVTWEIDEEGVSGPGFDDLPGRDYMLNVPIISFESGDQLSVMSARSVYQAVAVFSDQAIWWPARRLSGFLQNAVELENRDMLDWDSGVPTIRQSGRPEPFDPDLLGPDIWRWEPIVKDGD